MGENFISLAYRIKNTGPLWANFINKSGGQGDHVMYKILSKFKKYDKC